MNLESIQVYLKNKQKQNTNFCSASFLSSKVVFFLPMWKPSYLVLLAIIILILAQLIL